MQEDIPLECFLGSAGQQCVGVFVCLGHLGVIVVFGVVAYLCRRKSIREEIGGPEPGFVLLVISIDILGGHPSRDFLLDYFCAFGCKLRHLKRPADVLESHAGAVQQGSIGLNRVALVCGSGSQRVDVLVNKPIVLVAEFYPPCTRLLAIHKHALNLHQGHIHEIVVPGSTFFKGFLNLERLFGVKPGILQVISVNAQKVVVVSVEII